LEDKFPQERDDMIWHYFQGRSVNHGNGTPQPICSIYGFVNQHLP
jgi:hypothetical protein